MAFDEKSGIVSCNTDWGQWWQNLEEVYVEIDVPEGCSANDIKCICKTKYLSVTVKGKIIIDVSTFYSYNNYNINE